MSSRDAFLEELKARHRNRIQVSISNITNKLGIKNQSVTMGDFLNFTDRIFDSVEELIDYKIQKQTGVKLSQKHGNVIHLPLERQCEDCWFFLDDSDGCTEEYWCGLLARHMRKRECQYDHVIVKKEKNGDD